MQKDRYLFMPSYSLEPNKISLFNKVYIKIPRPNQEGITDLILPQELSRTKRLSSNNQIKRTSHNFTISENAYRNLKRKINWLYYLAKSKSIKTYNGKSIYNFKIGFHTFTLPSKQTHNTATITNQLWNQFLTEIRQRTDMQNYIWRLEFQKNGNVHYHLVTDTYLDYFFNLKIWNRILKSYGYIEAYKQKHENLSFAEYSELYNSENRIDRNVLAKRYAKGKSQKWEQPNSVDSKSVISKKAISFYISKYFAKDSKNGTIKNELDNDDNSSNMRLWFCSRSLSKLNTVTDFCELMQEDLFGIVKSIKEVVCKVAKYATTWYFDIYKAIGWNRKVLEQVLKNYAFSTGYQPSG